MRTKNPRSIPWGRLLALTILMALTRSHHWANLHALPDASWAVFFLVGLGRGGWRTFLALCGLATAIDGAAIQWGGVSSFCVTPAYALLLPCYAALWLGGRWAARQGTRERLAWGALVLALCVSALVAELIASGGFYFFGGRFADPTLAGFLPRLLRYFPGMLGTLALYVSLTLSAWGALAAQRPDKGTWAREVRR